MKEEVTYEIAHDLLARQVFARFSAEEKTLRKAERMLIDSYELHNSLIQSQDGSRLLNREEILFLKPYLKQIRPDENILTYLETSEEAVFEAEKAEKRKLEAEIARQKEEQLRQKKWLRAAIVTGLLMLAISIFAGISYKQANDSKITVSNQQDSLRHAFTELEMANGEVLAQKDTAIKSQLQAERERSKADSLRLISDKALIDVEESNKNLLKAQKQVLARERKADSLRKVSDSLRSISDSEKKKTQVSLNKIIDAQGRELLKLQKAIYNLQYDDALSILLDATKFGVFNPKIKPNILELAYYFDEVGADKNVNILLEELGGIEGTSRGGDSPGIVSRPVLDEILGEDMWQALAQRYYPQVVKIKGGTFQMGTSMEGEKKYHEVTLNDFEISPNEITVFQYELFLRSEGQSLENFPRPDWDWKGDFPMTSVNWLEAIRYCNWLSKRMGLKEVYNLTGNQVQTNWEANGFRLPTEAEWEYAAGGGLVGRDTKGFLRNTFSGSKNSIEVGWYDQDSPSAVKKLKCNELGLFDMSGNVMEWCFDWYGIYPDEARVNPRGILNGDTRVVRGGSWEFDKSATQVDFRTSYDPFERFHDLGFRVVRSIHY